MQDMGQKVKNKGQLDDYGCVCARIGSRGTKEGTLAVNERLLGLQASIFWHDF